MKELWTNFVESFYLGYHNLCGINKVLLIILLLPGGFNGAVTIIEGVKWLIEKF